jgi:hypothetical protein
MSLSTHPENSRGCPQTATSVWRGGRADAWWSRHGEASLNWLALGLLLAAWNASDNEAPMQARGRPEALRGYSRVSVRAVTHHFAERRETPTN